MTFEENLRERIKAAPFGSAEKGVLKLVLGECQQEMSKLTDEKGHSIVKKLIKSNEECLAHLPEGDNRRTSLAEEITVLQGLLPQYWAKDQIRAQLGDLGLKEMRSEGQAIGAAMKHLKSLDAPVEGETVKSVVAEMRA